MCMDRVVYGVCRPWYAVQAAVIPRDIVAVVDISYDMAHTSYKGHTLLDTAREAVATVFNSLASQDTVCNYDHVDKDLIRIFLMSTHLMRRNKWR